MSKDIIKKIKSDPALCKKWEQNRLVNPITGRKIKKDGPTYNKLMKFCNQMKVGQLKTPTKTPKPTKVTAAFGSTAAKARKERAEKAKAKRVIIKKIIKKKQKEAAKERKEKKEERAERKLDTPTRVGKTENLLERISDFVKEMNATNKKQVVLNKYKDLSDFIKFAMDPENEFDITSEDYKEFEKAGKFKKIKNPYVDFRKLLEDLEDYKTKKALLHLHHFIERYSKYKSLILNIIDKQLPIKKGPVVSIKLEKKDVKDMNTKELLKETEKMVKEMNETNKTNEKKEILERYKHLKKIIKYVYDPDLVFGVKSKYYMKWEDNDKKKKRVVISPIRDIFKLLDALADRKLTGDKAMLDIYNFIHIYKAHKELILNILDKSLKIRLNKNTISDVFPGLFSTFEPVLANKFKQSILDKTDDDWYMSRKLDGVRCLVIVNKKSKKVTSHSRTGKKFTTLRLLEESLLRHIDEFETSVALDGEVIVENMDGQESFKGLMEQIKRKNYTIPDPQYRVFDMIPIDVFMGKSKGEILSKRNEKLVEMFIGGRIKHVRALRQIKFTPEKFEKFKKKASDNNWGRINDKKRYIL